MKMSSAFFVSRKDDAMNVFEAVKQNVTTRQAAELYGIRVGRNGMAVCPFHNDKEPQHETWPPLSLLWLSGRWRRSWLCFPTVWLAEQRSRYEDSWWFWYQLWQQTETVNQTKDTRTYPGAEISAGRKSLLQGAVWLLPSSEEVGKAIHTTTDGWSVASAFCGSVARRKAISNTCWIFFSMTLPKKRKLL